MVKCILMSIKPKYVSMILNKAKTIEVRKRFPSDYVGWVYIYCTKGGDMICYRPNFDGYACVPNLYGNEYFNGKVVARFWCDKVDEFYDFDEDLCEQACLDRGEMLDYLGDKNGYAIHITKLEIFDIPRTLQPFFNLDRPPQSWFYIEI